jgi:hypothetical protein
MEKMLENLRFFGNYIGMPDTDPRLILARLIHMALGFVGVILLLAILSSGFSFMIAGGDEEKTASAKRTLINAIIGVFIILCAYSIVNFVLNGLTAATTGV